MKQSRWASFGETALNTFAGFGLSLFLQWLYFDVWLGFPLHIGQNLTFAVIMTAVSLARGFSIRRLCEALGIRVKLSPAMQAVIAERRRQIDHEGYDAAHDDQHTPEELAAAGAAYLLSCGAGKKNNPPICWRWHKRFWNPKDIRRDLVRGMALGLAGLELLDRSRKPKRRT